MVVVAVLPGALYVWGFEREAGPFGVSVSDRVLRFLSASMLIHLVAAWPLYGVWQVTLRDGLPIAASEFALLWGAAAVLLVGASAGGSLVGILYATRNRPEAHARLRRMLRLDSPTGRAREERLLRLLLGRTPAPRAWDSLFAERPDGFLRVRMANGDFVVGRFAAASYAGSYPAERDLLLEEVYSVSESGAIGSGLGYAVYLPETVIEGVDLLGGDQDG